MRHLLLLVFAALMTLPLSADDDGRRFRGDDEDAYRSSHWESRRDSHRWAERRRDSERWHARRCGCHPHPRRGYRCGYRPYAYPSAYPGAYPGAYLPPVYIEVPPFRGQVGFWIR